MWPHLVWIMVILQYQQQTALSLNINLFALLLLKIDHFCKDDPSSAEILFCLAAKLYAAE